MCWSRRALCFPARAHAGESQASSLQQTVPVTRFKQPLLFANSTDAMPRPSWTGVPSQSVLHGTSQELPQALLAWPTLRPELGALLI